MTERSHERTRFGVCTTSRETDDVTSTLTIDCDECRLEGSESCDDCVVSFLLGRDPEDAVVVNSEEARALKMLERAGLASALRFEHRRPSDVVRAASVVGR